MNGAPRVRKEDVILLVKPTRCTNFSNLFLSKTLRVSHSISVHQQESSTVHTSIGIYHTGFADCLLAGSDPARKQSANLCDIYLLVCVQC